MGEFVQDLRVGARQLVQRPGFAAASILSLALGVGVNTTLFTIVNAVLVQVEPGGRSRPPGRDLLRGERRAPAADHVVSRLPRRARPGSGIPGGGRACLRPRCALHRHQAAARHRRGGHGQLLRRARHPTAARPRLHGGGIGHAGRRRGRRRQPRAVAAAARRPAGSGGDDGEALGTRLHRDRRSPGGVPGHRPGHSRPTSGCRSR